VERELTPAGAPEEVLIPRAMPPAIIERAAGAPFFRLFHVAATGNLTLDGLTLAGGNIVGEGGGLRNRGRTVVMHSTLTDNAADYGGGFSNEGALTITDSDIVRGRAQAGAGILNSCTLTVVNTTIADNVADEWGGIANLGQGPVVITNATVARNSADGIFGGGALPIWAAARWHSRTPSSPSTPPPESSVRIVSGGSSHGVIICSGTRPTAPYGGNPAISWGIPMSATSPTMEPQGMSISRYSPRAGRLTPATAPPVPPLTNSATRTLTCATSGRWNAPLHAACRPASPAAPADERRESIA
jgi:hypothetical protein